MRAEESLRPGRLVAPHAVEDFAQVTYVYDDADRLTSITRDVAQVVFTYDNANRIAGVVLPNGVSLAYTYDADGHVTDLTYALGATTMGGLTYGYDAAGQRVSVGGTYARVLLPGALPSASLDNANQLIQHNGVSFSYDASGNLTSDGTRTFSWNARNELISVSGPNPASFTYEALGRRISRTVGGVTTGFLYDELNVVQEQISGITSSNLLTGLGLDEVFTRIEASGSQSLMPDVLGSTIAAANHAGVVQAEYSYGAFGTTTVVGASTNPTQFAGRENDGTGHYYYGARYYDPSLQRFISEDPIGFAGGPQSARLRR
jgi:RHS repeat-associated protein